MKNTLFAFLVFLATLLPTHSVWGAETPAEIQETNCAVEGQGDVVAGDGTLCEQDIAFGMLYELFPSIFNELIPLWNLSRFSEYADQPSKPELLGEYQGDQVFFVLFDLFYKLILFCIAIYAGILLVSVASRWLKGESLMDRNSPKDSPVSISVGVFAGGAFFIPIKQFFLGQLVVFSIGIISLSMANFVYSFFLAGNQTIFQITADIERTGRIESASNEQNRHDFMADLYYRTLTRMQLCRHQSSQYILSSIGGQYSDPFTYRKASQCTLPPTTSVVANWGDNSKPAPFVQYDTAIFNDRSETGINFSGGTQFTFSAQSKSSDYCRIEEEYLPNYNCGSITVNNPNWNDNPLIRLFGNDAGALISRHLSSLKNNLTSNASPNTIRSVLEVQWLEFKDELLEKLKDRWDESHSNGNGSDLVAIDNKVVRREDALNEAMIDNARPHLLSAAQFFHQNAMNILMFGYVDKYMENDRIQLNSVDWSNLKDHLAYADELAETIIRAQCMEYKHDLGRSQKTLDFLRGEAEFLPQDASARCLDVTGQEVMELDPDYSSKTPEQIRSEALQRFAELEQRMAAQWEEAAPRLSEQRKAVEEAFVDAVNTDTVNEWWVTLRQKGFLSVADYAQSINERVNGFKRSLKQVVNNFSVSAPVYDDKYVSSNLDRPLRIDRDFAPFSYAGDQLFSQTRLEDGMKDPLIANAQWIAEQQKIIREKPLAADSSNLIEDIIRIVGVSDNYLDRLGISLEKNGKDQEQCLQDPSKCPFPLSDPIVEISLMGHDMVDVAIGFFSAAIPAKILSGKKMEQALMKRQRGGGSVSTSSVLKKIKKISNGSAWLGGITGVMESVGKGVVSFAALMDMIFDLFSTIMLMFLALGLLLAYLLPLVPKIYLYLTFISWLMVLVMASFSVFLWSFYWFRYKEKRELLKSAGYHYGVELLFKPTFAMVAVIFAWYFFYVTSFIIGVGAGWVWSLPVDGGILRSVVDTLVVLLVLMFVYLVGLKYAYQLMGDMTDDLLRMLGVNDSKQQDKISELVKVILFDQAQRVSKSGMNKLDKNWGRDAGKQHLMQRAQNAQQLSARYNKSRESAMNESNDSNESKGAGS